MFFWEIDEVVLQCIYMGASKRSSSSLVPATNSVVVALEVLYLLYVNICVAVILCWVPLFLSILSLFFVSILLKFEFYFFDMDQEERNCFIICNCNYLEEPSCFIIFNSKELQ